MKANASLEKTWTDKRCQEALKEELKNNKALKAKIQKIANELHETQKTSFNTTDPDCNKVKGRQGVQAGYNMRSVVDDQHGLVVSTDVVADSNDRNPFSSQVNQAQKTLEASCQTVCADAGYANTNELKIISD